MKITIEAEPKEIAALVLAIQERQVEYEPMSAWVDKILKENPGILHRNIG